MLSDETVEARSMLSIASERMRVAFVQTDKAQFSFLASSLILLRRMMVALAETAGMVARA